MKTDRTALSSLEWEIMSVIWTVGGKPSVREILDHAYPKGEKAYTTVQTVMNNLEQKGFLKKEKIGMVNFYKPIKKQDDSIKKRTNNFVNNVFGGSFHALASHLVDSDSLTKDEILELKKLLNQKSK